MGSIVPPRDVLTDHARFFDKIDASGDCWEWTASRNHGGHPWYHNPGGTQYAHRVAWEILVGPIPEGYDVDHLCRVRHCVNPDHLEPVPHVVNVRRGHVGKNSPKGPNSRGLTHCKRGHEYTEENTIYHSKNGSRMCRSCRRNQ